MSMFDFMSDEVFRTSLESDYCELELCLKAGAWKAVHVLAGSIIETILIDYLIATNYPERANIKLSKVTFFEVIEICKKERIISVKAGDLSQVVREYRNLIHPERLKRLGETADENGATVAQALVKMVIKDIEAKRKDIYGYTAEQLVKKILGDTSVIPILGHMLKETKKHELRLMLLKVLPSHYFSLLDADEIAGKNLSFKELNDLEECFRLAFDAVSEDIKWEVMSEYVRVLKEENVRTVNTYERAFLRGSDLQYCSVEDARLIKSHFFSSIKGGIKTHHFKFVDGIGWNLTSEEVELLVDVFVKSIANFFIDVSYKKLLEVLIVEFYIMPTNNQKSTLKRIVDWLNTYKEKKVRPYNHYIKMLDDLRLEMVAHLEVVEPGFSSINGSVK